MQRQIKNENYPRTFGFWELMNYATKCVVGLNDLCELFDFKYQINSFSFRRRRGQSYPKLSKILCALYSNYGDIGGIFEGNPNIHRYKKYLASTFLPLYAALKSVVGFARTNQSSHTDSNDVLTIRGREFSEQVLQEIIEDPLRNRLVEYLSLVSTLPAIFDSTIFSDCRTPSNIIRKLIEKIKRSTKQSNNKMKIQPDTYMDYISTFFNINRHFV